MTKMELLAKLTLTMLGIFVLVELLNYLLIPPVDGFNHRTGEVVVSEMLVLIVFLGAMCLLVDRLLFHSGKWAKKVVGDCSEGTGTVKVDWVVASFRITLLFCGLLIMSGSIDFLLSCLAFVMRFPKVPEGIIMFRGVDSSLSMSPYAWMQLFIEVCKVTLGTYLILGAPRFVRWHIKKSAQL